MKFPLHVFLISLIVVVTLSSCAGAKWREERSVAHAAGGRTFTNFVLNNRQGMHDHLTYDEELSDLEKAYRYANTAEKDQLYARYYKVRMDQKREEQRQARSRAWANAAGNYSAPSSNPYTPPSSTSYSDALQRNRDAQFNDRVRRIENNQPQLRSNPYTSY